MKSLFYQLISGPQRELKVALFAASGIVGLVAVAGAALGYVPVWAAAGGLCLGALLVLAIVLQLRQSGKLNDLHYELSLQTNLAGEGWTIPDLFLDGAAANPSLMLLVFKVLKICRPQRILELGSGQTTKLLGLYYRTQPGAYILTLEHDAMWVQILTPMVTHAGRVHDYRHAPLQPKAFACAGTGTRIETRWYDDQGALAGQSFNLILVDGPNRTSRYSRSGVLQHLPAALATEFVVIFDDAERAGEIETVEAFDAMLGAANLAFERYEVNGVKRQVVFCSPSFSFLKYT